MIQQYQHNKGVKGFLPKKKVKKARQHQRRRSLEQRDNYVTHHICVDVYSVAK